MASLSFFEAQVTYKEKFLHSLRVVLQGYVIDLFYCTSPYFRPPEASESLDVFLCDLGVILQRILGNILIFRLSSWKGYEAYVPDVRGLRVVL